MTAERAEALSTVAGAKGAKLGHVAFPKNLLTKDEEIVLDLVPHWWFIAKASAILAGTIVFALITLFAWDVDWLRAVAGVAVLLALAYFGLIYAQWRTTNFVVTNERIISRTGVVSKKGIEIPVDRINTVFFEQGAFERMIGAGSLMVESAGEGGQQTFQDVRSPNKVQAEIYKQMEGFEERRHQRMAQAVGGVQQPPEPSIPDQIAELDELRKAGTISEEEFATKKQELLDRM